MVATRDCWVILAETFFSSSSFSLNIVSFYGIVVWGCKSLHPVLLLLVVARRYDTSGSKYMTSVSQIRHRYLIG